MLTNDEIDLVFEKLLGREPQPTERDLVRGMGDTPGALAEFVRQQKFQGLVGWVDYDTAYNQVMEVLSGDDV